jgi:hypothetical protein
MNEQQAKRHLTKILGSFTAGSILHLLAEVVASAEADGERAAQSRQVEHALIVLGLGIDAMLPS